ncbi:MAG: lamin tail domain-containing protein [Flavobacteriales bacterium]|jgi:hypothetical protein|nr:lamin tail domain-containing protein [Flavobacteriales bacterium]
MRFFLLIVLFAIPFVGFSQPVPPGSPAVVITEIMYNPPESGADSLEFVELGNPSQVNERSLSEYFFSEGVDFTFPSGYLIAPGAYVIIAEDSVAFENAFGVVAFEWNNSSLLNTGEAIVFKSSAGQTVDSVNYGISTPWPSSPNGSGTSLVLCNDTLDNNDPNNWSAATTNAGFSIDNVTVFANPNAGCDGLTGIEVETRSGLNIYPNPSYGQLEIGGFNNFETGTYALELLRLNGQLVLQRPIKVTAGNSATVNLPVGAGLYLLRIIGSDEISQQRLLILE